MCFIILYGLYGRLTTIGMTSQDWYGFSTLLWAFSTYFGSFHINPKSKRAVREDFKKRGTSFLAPPPPHKKDGLMHSIFESKVNHSIIPDENIIHPHITHNGVFCSYE